MSTKLKCHQNGNVTNPENSQKLKCHQNSNVTKNEIGLLNWTLQFNSRSSALIALAFFMSSYKVRGICVKNIYVALNNVVLATLGEDILGETRRGSPVGMCRPSQWNSTTR